MGEALEGELMEREVDSGASLMAINASEINQQIATAKRYPRSIKEFVREATEMVSMNQTVAQECMYSLKRGRGADTKVIEGPSARMAEVVASAWGNCRAGARVISEDDRFVTAQGAFIDLQRNVAITYEVRRRITDSRGNKYSDDMVGVTANAACSIALRNAVFKGVPKAFWQEIYRVARQTAIGDAKTLGTRRSDMLAAFAKMGVEKEKVFAYLEVKGIEDVSLDHLGLMLGVFQAIRDGETTIDDTFTAPTAGGKVGESSVGDKFGKGKKPEGEAGEQGNGNAQTAEKTTPEADTQQQQSESSGTSSSTPGDDPLLPWQAMIDEAGSDTDLNSVDELLTKSTSLNSNQKATVLAWIGERRKKVGTPKKSKKGNDGELFATNPNTGA
jgi:hypothetical protein